VRVLVWLMCGWYAIFRLTVVEGMPLFAWLWWLRAVSRLAGVVTSRFLLGPLPLLG